MPRAQSSSSGSHLRKIETSDELFPVLTSILETIIHLPWLSTGAGGIFLADEENRQLVLAAQINFTPFIAGACTRVEYGHCLCGRVAESGQLLHVDCVDEHHETRYEGMEEHGHYVVPIKLGDTLLGVMVLYIEAGHACDSSEVGVLENFAAIVARIIQSSRLQQEKELADLILAHSSGAVMITDRDKRIQWVNRAFEQISGFTAEDVLGKTPAILRSGRHGKDFYAAMWEGIKRHGFWEGEVWNRRKNGELYPEWLNIVALKDRTGKVLSYAGMSIDLTPVKEAEKKIERLAYYDSVTQLPNASLLHDRLERLLHMAATEGGHVLVMMVDLLNFHEINGGLGRSAGDAVLRETARRIKGALEGAVEARTGADEFVIACHVSDENADIEQLAVTLAKRIGKRLQPAYQFGQHEFTLGGAIGIAADSGKGMTVDSLLRHATIALSHCKKHPQDGHAFFNSEMERETEYQRLLGAAIGKAIERKELRLAFQAQVDRTGRVIGAEVLLRWHSREYGNVSPEVFIALAEERGAILDIGRWVFEQTVEQMASWRAAGLCETFRFSRLAVNISPQQMLSRATVAQFYRCCANSGIPPESIELELTETGIMQYSDNVIDQFRALSEMGFKVAIDDFGTGHSSLSRLRNFPVDVLKIDRSFVSNIEEGNSDAALVRSIIDLAHTMGFEVIAEGVETADQLRLLKDFGCDLFQGYYFSKPLSADEFVAYVKQQLAANGDADD